MTDTRYAFYVGIDWASAAHQVVVLDHERRPVADRSVAHTGAALDECATWLATMAAGHSEQVGIAIEVPRGAVVETLLERGFHVFAINPKQLDRFRDRHTVAGAKDDRRDGLVLADSLATDQPAFRRLRPEEPAVIQLRELTRVDEDLQDEERRLSNRLREQLQRVSPPLLAFCPGADEPWVWALLAQAPTPEQGRRLTRAAVARLLAEHRIRRVTADEIVAQLRTPPLFVAPGTVAAVAEHISLLVPRLELLRAQRRHCAGRIERVLKDLEMPAEGQEGHRDATIFRSLPGAGRVVVATMLAEASRPLADRDYHALRAQGGVAPVTRQSGKRHAVHMRHACNPRVRQALYHWARVSTQYDPATRRHYDALRGKGHSHGRALRGVADRLLALLVAMLKAGATYQPERRRAWATA